MPTSSHNNSVTKTRGYTVTLCRYNVSHVANALGDKTFAHQALRVAVSLNSSHAEAWTNLGVLASMQGNITAARSSYKQAQEMAAGLFEPWYNNALAAFKAGNLEVAHKQASVALECHPAHASSQELLRLVTQRCASF